MATTVTIYRLCVDGDMENCDCWIIVEGCADSFVSCVYFTVNSDNQLLICRNFCFTIGYISWKSLCGNI